MNQQSYDSHMGGTVTWISTWLVGLGVLTMALFPFALPFLILTIVFTLPLLLPVIPLALAAALWLGLRAVVRGIRGGQRPRPSDPVGTRLPSAADARKRADAAGAR